MSWKQRIAAVGLGLGVLVAVELGLRLTDLHDGEHWAPPVLVDVVEQGRTTHRLQLTQAPRFVPAGSAHLRPSPAHASRMRPGEWTIVPSHQRYLLSGGSAAVGQAGMGQGAPSLPPELVEGLPGGPGLLREDLAISGQLASLTGAEVINAGLIAQDSDELVATVRDGLALGPSAVLLYAGNNESLFLSRLLEDTELPVAPVRSRLRQLRLYRLLAGLIQASRRAPSPQETTALSRHGRDRVTWEIFAAQAAVQAEWEAAGRPLVDGDLPTDTAHAAILARWRRNLETIAADLKQAGVQLVIVPTPPRLTAQVFAPAHGPGLPIQVQRAASAHEERAVELLRSGDPAGARAAAQEGIDADDAWAPAWLALGVALDMLGEPSAATDALLMAMALDVSRKRASPALAQVAAEVCEVHGCTTFDAHAVLVERARSEGPGAVYDRFHGDHEHLSPEGSARMAMVFAALLEGDEERARQALLGPAPQVPGASTGQRWLPPARLPVMAPPRPGALPQ